MVDLKMTWTRKETRDNYASFYQDNSHAEIDLIYKKRDEYF